MFGIMPGRQWRSWLDDRQIILNQNPSGQNINRLRAGWATIRLSNTLSDRDSCRWLLCICQGRINFF